MQYIRPSSLSAPSLLPSPCFSPSAKSVIVSPHHHCHHQHYIHCKHRQCQHPSEYITIVSITFKKRHFSVLLFASDFFVAACPLCAPPWASLQLPSLRSAPPHPPDRNQPVVVAQTRLQLKPKKHSGTTSRAGHRPRRMACVSMARPCTNSCSTTRKPTRREKVQSWAPTITES